MIKIAVIDDERDIAEMISERMIRYSAEANEKIETIIYTEGQSFLDDYHALDIQALFLDLDMPNKSGFDISKLLRENNIELPIVYVTNRDDLMQKAFQYKVLGFVRKNHLDEELPYAIQCVLHEIEVNTKTITVTSSQKKYKLKICDIVYIESENHDVQIYLNNQSKPIRVRGILNAYIENAGFKKFIQISSSCIANYEYIFSIEKDYIILQNEDVLYISRRKVKSVKEQFLFLSRRRFL